jgi:hypothetical protein
MKERSYTVRVFTHPKTWGNQHFLRAGVRASPPSASPFFRASTSSDRHTSLHHSIPRTYTITCESKYSISANVIQRVIWKFSSRVAPHFSTCEAA